MRISTLCARLFMAGLVSLSVVSVPVYGASDTGNTFRWVTVVNKHDVMPNSVSTANPDGRTFNSFNQPSVNAHGLVVFRARSRGGPPLGPPTRGIYTRDMSRGDVINSEIGTIAGGSGRLDRGATIVPEPNNLHYPPTSPSLTAFIEFPSIPRIGIQSSAIATRGNHQPVWEYSVGGDETTRAGTTGVYVNLIGLNPYTDDLVAGATKLGGVPGFEFYSVPGVESYIPFDVFPGAPAITDEGIIAFKGNYTENGTPKTGVYYREVTTAPAGGEAPVVKVANSDTSIPNINDQGQCSQDTFGSTAPPSAAVNKYGLSEMVFVGLDYEASPSCGGIYKAPLVSSPPLVTLVSLGSAVPGVADATFNQLGEGLSFDGRFVGFWGAWGSDTRTLRLYCPAEGNKDRIDFCNHAGDFGPGGTLPGDPNSICDDASDDTDRCYQEKQVPVNQGIFVHDAQTGKTYLVSRTGRGSYTDFVYWVYSGRVPGTGGSDHGEEGGDEGDEEDGEFTRWRSSAFNAVSGRGAAVWVAFKAKTAEYDADSHAYVDAVNGVYLGKRPGNTAMKTVIDTTMAGTVLDPDAVDTINLSPLPIVELGIERDGFRGPWLVLTASMGEESDSEEEADSQAGIYMTKVP